MKPQYSVWTCSQTIADQIGVVSGGARARVPHTSHPLATHLARVVRIDGLPRAIGGAA